MKLTDVKTREQIPAFLISLCPRGAVGVELGVHRGEYSETLLEGNVGLLYSIDRWAGDRGHGMVQYAETMRRLEQFSLRSRILRATFDEARTLFPAESLDFVYIDGYAHTGQDDGKTIRDWWAKLKPGGLFAGHDYHPTYPKTIAQVDQFVKEVGCPMRLTEEKKYPSWMLIK